MSKPQSIRTMDNRLLRSIRDLCPKEGSGINTITVTTGKYEAEQGIPATGGAILTVKTRRRIDAELKRRRER